MISLAVSYIDVPDAGNHDCDKLAIQAERLAQKLSVPLFDSNRADYDFLLLVTAQQLQLHDMRNQQLKPIVVDFTRGANWHRYQYGGGKGQLIAKAVGIHKHAQLTVLDTTAGLGGDAFVLASLGCEVTMLERSPIIAALLQDGLARARTQDWFKVLKLVLLEQSAHDYLQTPVASHFDVIYIDPMFPHSNKSALVKKEMRVLRECVGDDLDAAALLLQARGCAKKRVVVKRPRLAPYLAELSPDHQYRGKSGRFDVYYCTS